MKKISIIIAREYITRVRKPIFYITTLLLPFLFAGLIVLEAYLIQSKGKAYRIAVIDETGMFKNKLSDDRDMFFKDEDISFEKIKMRYDTLGYEALLHIPKDFDLKRGTGIELLSKEQMGLSSEASIKEKLSKVVYSLRLKENNVDEKIVEEAGKEVGLNVYVQNGNEEKQGNAAIGTGIGLVAGILVYFMMFLYGNMVMRSIMEEKQTRIVEVIMSSVRPVELMLGKIVGVGLVGLTQFILWIILTFGVQMFMGMAFHNQMSSMNSMQAQQALNADDTGNMAKLIASLIHQPWGLIAGSFVFYFLGGYLLYAALFAAVGSAMSEDMEDNRALNFIISIPLLIAYLMMWAALKDPYSNMSIVGSLIPFTSPIVMMARITLGVPNWQIITSMLLLVLGFLFTTWVAGRIYRTSILMYGKKITPKELLKWAIRSN